jgi:hypothetical protein
MTFMSESEPGPSIPVEDFVNLAREVFRLYRLQHGLEDEQGVAVKPDEFAAWFRQERETWSTDESDAVCQAAGVDRQTEVYAAFNMLLDEPELNQLRSAWPHVVLAFRELPREPLERLTVIALLQWQDGRATPLLGQIPATHGAATLNDANVTGAIQLLAERLSHSFMASGLNELHDQLSVPAQRDQYELLMGLLIKILQGAIIIDPETKQQLQIPVHLREGCHGVMRLFQAMYSAIMPAHLAFKHGMPAAPQSANTADTGSGWTGSGWDA